MVDTGFVVSVRLLVVLLVVPAGFVEALVLCDDEAVVPGVLSGAVDEVPAEVSDVLSALLVLSVEVEEVLLSLSEEEPLSADESAVPEASDISDEDKEVSDVG